MIELEKLIENKKPMKIDLENGIILDLNWDKEIKAYRGYSKEIDMKVGIWLPETLIKIATEKGWGCHIIVD